MKRGLKIGCAALLAAQIIALAYVLNAFFGNPVSFYLAERSGKAYLEENYAHLNLQIDWFGYSFKDANYYMTVSDTSSRDIHFSIYMRPNGEVRYDTYDSVESGWNTWGRLDSEYRMQTRALFDVESFELRNDIAFGSIEIDEESVFDFRPVSYGVKLDKLVVDGEYDLDELAARAGHIVFYMQDEDVSFETAARGMLRLKELLDENGLEFFAMDFVLRLPREEGQPGNGGPEIHVQNFLRSDIYEEGMAQRVQAAHEALSAFYEELDQAK